MKTITSFICVAFALLLGPFALLLQAQAVVPAPDGVSLDDNPSLALQNDAYVDNDGKLGVYLSARRFKTDIADMNSASEALLRLRPVTFRYKPEVKATNAPQFGLIAEEVAAVNPNLVTRDGKGELSTVRYEAVNAMLLNEFLKEHRKNEEQQATIAMLKSAGAKQEAIITQLKTTDAKQEATIVRQQKQIEALTAGLQKVSAQLELGKPAPQTVKNTD